jgi:ubiquinone/menaquinone biosynthesis C-methylase UbiE
MEQPSTPETIRSGLFKVEEIKGPKLNLACGADYIEGWINLDGDESIKADVYHNLDDEYLMLPFPNQEFELIYAAHILEHITHIHALKREMMRILKPGGKLCVIVPSYLSPDAWGDDTHIRAFSIHSFYPQFWPNGDKIEVRQIDAKDQLGTDIHWFAALITKKGDTE